MFPHTNTSRKFPVKTHCISQSDNLLPEQRTENNHSNMPDGAIISTTSPHENFCLKRTHTILSSTITRIAKNQKIHRIFTLVAFHPENLPFHDAIRRSRSAQEAMNWCHLLETFFVQRKSNLRGEDAVGLKCGGVVLVKHETNLLQSLP